MTLDLLDIRRRLRERGCVTAQPDRWTLVSYCPAHGGIDMALTVRVIAGRLTLHCARCEAEDVARHAGLYREWRWSQ